MASQSLIKEDPSILHANQENLVQESPFLRIMGEINGRMIDVFILLVCLFNFACNFLHHCKPSYRQNQFTIHTYLIFVKNYVILRHIKLAIDTILNHL